ncbi:MAG: MBL fold metallo-hydrolase [Myxococcales bacterium]|nr:MBL fold metallo-hydrolase [Myxococcales bacterium]MCB9628028.1 MBL fold metallo-hydrolase [Sandaracinaceae bacterium]
MTDLRDIGVRIHSRYIFNCYVIEDGGAGAACVVDAGIPLNATSALETLRELGAGADVVLTATHAHSDHVAGLPALHAATGGGIWLPAKVEDYVRGQPARSPGPRAMLQIIPVLFDQPMDWAALGEALSTAKDAGFGLSPFVFEPPIKGYLRDSHTVPGAPDWEVLETPGHTDCSTCLWNKKTRTLLSGDTILSVNGRAWFNPEYVDGVASARTEALLRQLPVEHLLPGHGRPVSGARVMAEALSHLERPRGWSPLTCFRPGRSRAR